MKSNKKNKMQVKSRAGRKEERTAYLCLIPAFLGVSLISYLPTLAVFVLSVFKWNGLSSPEFVGLENFQRIFTKDIYFWSRPSCAGDGYDAASSGGSNKGPTNPEYLAEVEARIDSFLIHHPYLKRSEVPAEMVTASGSGLDPNITPACAYVQVKRVAQARGLSEEAVRAIVDKSVEKPLLGLFGTEKVNVLKLNVALEEAKK